MEIEFREEKVELKAGEMYLIPKGKEHKPYAKEECLVMLIEPRGVLNTGNVSSELSNRK